MTNFKEKTQFFIFGVVTGLLIAGSFFIFKLDDYFEKLKLYKNITKTFYLNTKKETDNSELDEKKQNEATTTFTSEYKKNKKETLKKETEKQNEDASANTMADVDTSTFVDLPEQKEEFVIEKDELISSTTLQIINLNVLTAAEHLSDSLLKKVSGIRDDKNLAQRSITVELWKSPLHYKGYKMTKNKLVIYGFPVVDNMSLFQLDDVVYMEIMSSFYRLEQTYDYKPYHHIEDPAIISKLK